MIAIASDAAAFLEKNGEHDLASAVYLLLAEAAHLRSLTQPVACHHATCDEVEEPSS